MTLAHDLLVISPTFHPEPIGTPFYATDATQWFRQRGVDVAVLTAMPFYPGFRRYPGYGRRRRHDRLDDVPIYRVPTVVPRGGAVPLRAISDVNFAVQALVAIRAGWVGRARAVLAFSPGVPLVMAVGAAALQPGGTHVGIVHDLQTGLASAVSRLPGPLLALARRIEGRLLGRPHHLFALSEEMRSDLLDLGVRTPISVAPIWVDLAGGDDDATSLPPEPEGPITVMYSGNLGRKQGAMQLADIAARLQHLAPEIRLVIQGEGPLRPSLEAAVASGRLTNTTLAPLAPRSELLASLRSAHVHVVPQAVGVGDAAVPSKVFNTMAAGRPAVVAAAPGSAVDRLSRRSGGLVTVAPGDTAAAVDELVRLARDVPLRARLGQAGQRYVAAHHSRDAVLTDIACRLGLIA